MRRRAARGPGPSPDRRVAAVRRTPYDGEILRLALPALGALAAEPLYLLVDTAIVGHLGTPQLAALALAATVLVDARRAVHLPDLRDDRARRAPARRRAATRMPPRSAAQALWLALAVGGRARRRRSALAAPLLDALGGDGHVADLAARYLRIAALGLPMALVALAGQGWLRGMSDLRTPLVIVVAANIVNIVLEVLFVYGFGWGLDGSARGHRARAARHGRRVRGRCCCARRRSRAGPTSRGSARSRRSAPALRAHRLAAGLLHARHRRAARASARPPRGPPDRLPALRLPGARARRDRDRRPGHRRPHARRRRRRRGASPPRGGCSSGRSAAGLVIGGVLLALATCSRAPSPSDPDVIDRPQELWPLFARCGRWPPWSSRSTASSSAPATRATWRRRWSSPSSSSCRSCLVGRQRRRACGWRSTSSCSCASRRSARASLRRRWALVGAHA